jgi:hypothetical protein
MSVSAAAQVFAIAELRLEVCALLNVAQVLQLRALNTSLQYTIDSCPRLQYRLLKAKQDAFLEPVTDYQLHSVGVGEPTYNEHYGSHQRYIPVVDLNPHLHSQWQKWHDVLQHEVSIWLSIRAILRWDDRVLDTFFVQPPTDFSVIKLVTRGSDNEVMTSRATGNTLRSLRNTVVGLLRYNAGPCGQDYAADDLSEMRVVACLSGCSISCFGGFVPPSGQACQGVHEHFS